MQKDGFQIEQIEENKSQGFIKLYRSFKRWEWYDDANTMRVFLHCLFSANHKPTKWRGKNIERGSFVTSYRIMARDLNLGVQSIRTALNNLKTTKEITHKTTRHYSIITINNYDLYQDNNTQINNQITNEQQTANNQVTTNKKLKNNKETKEEKKKNFVAKSSFQELFTSDEEIKKYSHLKDFFIEFLEYKTAIKKQYKTEKTIRNAFLDFVRLSENDADYARALVDNAIARGWQSIYDLSKEQKKAFQKGKQINQSSTNDDWESRCM